MTIDQGRIASFDGIPIHTRRAGNDRIGVLLVHGWLGDGTYWEPLLVRLARDYTAVAIDLAGHGQSGDGRKRHRIESFARDLLAVIEPLNLASVVLVGHSMGGAVVLEAARSQQAPILGVICIDSPLHSYYRRMEEADINEWMAPFRTDFQGAVRKFAQRQFSPTADPRLVERVAKQMAAARPDVGLAVLEALFRHDVMPALSEIDVPIRAIATTANPRTYRLYQPAITITPMEGLGHFPMLEAPAPFRRQLRREIAAILANELGAEHHH